MPDSKKNQFHVAIHVWDKSSEIHLEARNDDPATALLDLFRRVLGAYGPEIRRRAELLAKVAEIAENASLLRAFRGVTTEVADHEQVDDLLEVPDLMRRFRARADEIAGEDGVGGVMVAGVAKVNDDGTPRPEEEIRDAISTLLVEVERNGLIVVSSDESERVTSFVVCREEERGLASGLATALADEDGPLGSMLREAGIQHTGGLSQESNDAVEDDVKLKEQRVAAAEEDVRRIDEGLEPVGDLAPEPQGQVSGPTVDLDVTGRPDLRSVVQEFPGQLDEEAVIAHNEKRRGRFGGRH